MNVRKFLLKKFPTNKYFDCPVPKNYYGVMQEYAEAYHESKVKELNLHIVSHRTFKPNDTEVEDMAVQIDQFINQHALAKPGTYSKKLRKFLANKLNEYGG